MNVNHVHQENGNSFNRCSHPSCNITKERLKKYCLLRSKENMLLEKYEKAAKVHDTITKRRQSIEVSHLFAGNDNRFLQVIKNSPKQRRFSTPNKPRQRSNTSSTRLLDTLDESNTDDDFDAETQISPEYIKSPASRKISVTPTPQGSSPIIPQRKISSSLTNLHWINVDQLNNSLQLLHEEADYFLQRSRKISSLNEIDRDAMPYWQRRLEEMNSSSTEEIYNDVDENDILFQRSRNFDQNELAENYKNVETKKIYWPHTPRHIEAKERLKNRKSMLENLDVDIRKVNKMLRDIKCKSMPAFSGNDYVTVINSTPV